MNELNDRFYAEPIFVCYEGDDGDDGSDGDHYENIAKAAEAEARLASEAAEAKKADAKKAGDDARKAKEAKFSQEEVNRFVADDRRKYDEKYQKLEASFKGILEDKNLAAEARAKMEAELQDLQKMHRTKEQQAEYERKQQQERYETELETARNAAKNWESMFKNSVIDRSLQDAAVSGQAFNPNQIVDILRPRTRMAEEMLEDGTPTGRFVPKIDFPDIDETSGEKISTLRTPEEAVQRMKELSDYYGNLFSGNVVSGIGSGAATGGISSGDGGRLDAQKIAQNPELYRRIREENPEALGLRKKR